MSAFCQGLKIRAIFLGAQWRSGEQIGLCAADPGLIQAGAEFPTGIQFWVITELGKYCSSSTSLDWVLGR